MAEDKENRQTYVKMEVSKEDNRNKALDKRDRNWQEAGHGIWLQEAASSSRPDIALAKSEQQKPEPTAPKWVLKARVAIDYHNCLEVQNHVPPKNLAALQGLAANGYRVSWCPDNTSICKECKLLGMEAWPIMTKWENHPWSEKKYGCLWKAVGDFLVQQALKD